MKSLPGIALVLLGLAYPFGVYFSLDALRPSWLAAAAALLWVLRAVLPSARPSASPSRALLPWLAALFCAALVCADSQASLRWYPVMINALLLATFAASLMHGPSMIERFARLRHPDLPPEGVRYTRRVTQVWCAFFVFNGGTAAVLAQWGSWDNWTLYNGVISYVLMGALLLGEWLIRPTPHQN